MQRIWSQCGKELAQFRRDRLTLALAFILPLMTLMIFGFAIRLEAKNIPIVVQDFDNSTLSHAYVDRLAATNQFQIKPWLGGDPLREALDSGLAKAAVILPPDFSRQIKAQKPARIQVLVDGSDVNNARVIKNSITATTQFFLRSEHLIPDRANKLVALVRLWFNPGRKESLYIVPGTYALVLWVYPSLLMAVAMVREKEKGTILQVYASSLSAVELLLGKGLAYWLVGILEAIVIMTLGELIFQLGFAGDPTPLLLGTLVYIADAVSFGLLIGVRAKVQNEAVQAVALLGFLSALLLSGFIYPLSNIPFPLSLLANLVPARYYIVVVRDAFVRGTGWPGVWFATLLLFLLGLLLFNAARRGLSQMQLKDGGEMH